MKRPRPTSSLARPSRGRALALALAAVLAVACTTSEGNDSEGDTSLRGTVTGPSGAPAAGATVYLVPSGAVSTQEITPTAVLDGSAEAFDEPLEDAVASQGASFVQAVTDAQGRYQIGRVPEGRFFLYVEPAADDPEHLPGGTFCRESADSAAFRGTTRDIVLSSSPPADALFVGMSGCIICHPDTASSKHLAHRTGLRVPGVDSPLQDTSELPEFDLGLEYFLPAGDYTGGTPVYHHDPDFTRDSDDFQTSLTDPTGDGGEVAAILWLWRSGGEHRITIENVANPSDPASPATRVVELTYGGALQRQSYLIDWPGRKGLYPLLQFQHEGDEDRFDRTRKVFRDFHLDYYWDTNGTEGDLSDDLIRDPGVDLTFERNCLGCHATGYAPFEDPDTGETLARTLSDPNGAYDIDGDGFINDINVSCEGCHGPGSAHVTAKEPRFILAPEYLSPSRSNQLCGRCHDSQQGEGGLPHAFSAEAGFPHPGIGRAELLADYVDPAAKGPPLSAYWPDERHSRVPQQQFADMLRSAHYRNPARLLACADCHQVHGGTGHENALVADPQAPDSPLCMICHGVTFASTSEHTAAQIGFAHPGINAACTDCHMNEVAQGGAGRYGFLLSPPTGTPADATEVYYENDTSSHLFSFPSKENVGVDGVLPIDAMPIPYTQSCGVCHDPSGLQDP